MSEPLPVTVVVPVRNEARNLPECLASLGSRFARVVVVDSGSSDGTIEIARKHGAEVVVFSWDGRYPKKRNWFLLNHPPATKWVLFLDADERVGAAFCDELAATLATTRHAGFWLTYANYFRGRLLAHGVRQRKLALFRVGAGLYEKIEEDGWSGLDMEVHEHPVVDGSTGEIATPLDHRDDQGLEKFLRRHVDYACWEARRFLRLDTDGAARPKHLTRRQRFKYRNLARWWYPLSYFLYAYVARLGFLDGAAGFHYALFKAWYFHCVRLMIADLRAKSH